MQRLGYTESGLRPNEITVDDYSVWIAKDIKEIIKTDNEQSEKIIIYSYDLTRYDIKEYLEDILVSQTNDVATIKDTLSILLSN